MDFFGEYTGLYFYSAVFQGNMALLALTGVFLVFKLQQMTTRIDEAGEHIRWFHFRFMQKGKWDFSQDSPSNYVAPEDYRSTLSAAISSSDHNEEFKNHARSLLADGTFQRLEGELAQRKAEAGEISQAFRRPLGLTALTISVSLILLMFARPLTLLSEWLLLITMVATACLNLYALFANANFIFTALNTDVPRWVRLFGPCCASESARGGESPDSPR